MRYKSKFDYSVFYEAYDDFACSQERFSRDQAIKLYIQEGIFNSFNPRDIKQISIGRAWVRYRYGYDSEIGPLAGWWLEYTQHPRACPVWVFHVTGTRDPKFEEGYSIIDLDEWKETQI